MLSVGPCSFTLKPRSTTPVATLRCVNPIPRAFLYSICSRSSLLKPDSVSSAHFFIHLGISCRAKKVVQKA